MSKSMKQFSVAVALAALLGAFSCSAIAGEYDGKWALNDSSGKPFEITLSTDGHATGTHNESMKEGTWEEVEHAAIIHWNTGWTTRISKQGDKYVKTAFKPGAALTDKPSNSSDAKRIN